MGLIYQDLPRVIREIGSAYTDEIPFDKGKIELENAGYQLISLKQGARLRMQEGRSFSDCPINIFREGFLYLSEKEVYLTKKSPVMTHPVDAVNVAKKQEGFYLTPEQTEYALTDSIKLPTKNFSIPTNRLGVEEVTDYAFGDLAQDYGYFLKSFKINEFQILFIGDESYATKLIKFKENKPFVIPIEFESTYQNGYHRLVGERDLYILSLTFHDQCIVRGVCEDQSASAEPNKPLRAYVPTIRYSKKQISEALKNRELSCLEPEIFKCLNLQSPDLYSVLQISTALKIAKLSGLEDKILEVLER